VFIKIRELQPSDIADHYESWLERIDRHTFSLAFQEGVATATNEFAEEFLTIYSKLYDNLHDVLSLFSGMPYIWTKRTLLSYLSSREVTLSRISLEGGVKSVLRGELLVRDLQRIGFLGLGIETHEAAAGLKTFNLHFEYLEDKPYTGNWSIAVLSPMFYDYINVRRQPHVLVDPHSRLSIPNSVWQGIEDLDVTR